MEDKEQKEQLQTDDERILTRKEFSKICYELLGKDFFAYIDAVNLGVVFDKWQKNPEETAQEFSVVLHEAIHSSVERRNTPLNWDDDNC